MILVCFPHYTAGGLMCDILSNHISQFSKEGGIQSKEHQLLKIGDSDTVQTSVDLEKFNNKLDYHKKQYSVFGTHCWAGSLPCEKFDFVVNITTQTNKSKLYRWARAYYHYYLSSNPWQIDNKKEIIDKQRETAKNYLIPQVTANADNVINIEFEDIVDTSNFFKTTFANYPFEKQMQNWKKVNKFLYKNNFWISTPIERIREAEYEVKTNQRWVYE